MQREKADVGQPGLSRSGKAPTREMAPPDVSSARHHL